MQERQNLHKKNLTLFQSKIADAKEMVGHNSIDTPSYLIVYVFNGTYRRGGIGHVSLWDGEFYYSYGLGDGKPWIAQAYNRTRSNEKVIQENIHSGYGPYKKIILPVNSYLANNYAYVRTNIHNKWKTNEYTLTKSNCAHMVQEYLVQAHYTKAIRDCSVFPLCPSEVADNAKSIGKALVDEIIAEILLQTDEKPYQQEQYKEYLNLLNNVLIMRPVLNKAQVLELRHTMNGKGSNRDKFCKVLSIIAHHHYDLTRCSYETKACDIFYENMLLAALEIQKKHPKFENKPQIAKTGVFKEPIGIARAMVGVLVVTIAFIPVCILFLLCMWYVGMSHAMRNRVSDPQPENSPKLKVCKP